VESSTFCRVVSTAADNFDSESIDRVTDGLRMIPRAEVSRHSAVNRPTEPEQNLRLAKATPSARLRVQVPTGSTEGELRGAARLHDVRMCREPGCVCVAGDRLMVAHRATPPESALQVMVPAAVMRQLRVLAARRGTTQRALVLEALRHIGLSVPAKAMADMRKTVRSDRKHRL
jgi:hypothetical protein